MRLWNRIVHVAFLGQSLPSQSSNTTAPRRPATIIFLVDQLHRVSLNYKSADPSIPQTKHLGLTPSSTSLGCTNSCQNYK
jgi:hypothetical protein